MKETLQHVLRVRAEESELLKSICAESSADSLVMTLNLFHSRAYLWGWVEAECNVCIVGIQPWTMFCYWWCNATSVELQEVSGGFDAVLTLDSPCGSWLVWAAVGLVFVMIPFLLSLAASDNAWVCQWGKVPSEYFCSAAKLPVTF